MVIAPLTTLLKRSRIFQLFATVTISNKLKKCNEKTIKSIKSERVESDVIFEIQERLLPWTKNVEK